MAYHFLQAPRNYDYIRALRWSQVSGFGGGALLARAVDFTRLAWQVWDPEEEAWWAGARQWLAGRPDLDPAQVTPIVDYLSAKRYGLKDMEIPPDPAFSMKGRSLAPLLRAIEEWHEDLATRKTVTHTEFRRSGVPAGRWEFPTEAEPLVWTIEEIRDSRSLLEEGHDVVHLPVGAGMVEEPTGVRLDVLNEDSERLPGLVFRAQAARHGKTAAVGGGIAPVPNPARSEYGGGEPAPPLRQLPGEVHEGQRPFQSFHIPSRRCGG
jgi:hypothetical protein